LVTSSAVATAVVTEVGLAFRSIKATTLSATL